MNLWIECSCSNTILDFLLRLLAREVAKSHIVEGPQYSIYQKRDQIWSLKLQNFFQYRKVNPSVLGNWSYWKKSSCPRHQTWCCSYCSYIVWFNGACWRTASEASNFNFNSIIWLRTKYNVNYILLYILSICYWLLYFNNTYCN